MESKSKIAACLIIALMLVGGCARPDLRKRLNRKTMLVRHSYLIDAYAVPQSLLLPSDLERCKWWFGHAKEIKGMVLMDADDLRWIIDNW